MKRLLVTCAMTLLMFAGVASRAENIYCLKEETPLEPKAKIAELTWDATNIEAPRALDAAAIDKFARTVSPDMDPPEVEEIGGFMWADLAGDGKYELLVGAETKAYGCLYIYWQDAPGKLRLQEYDGGGGDPAQIVKDLNGDGKKELILGATLDSEARTPSNSTPVAYWPQVYRLESGRYVEASHNFPRYYDTEILPEVEKRVSEMREEVAKFQSEPMPTPGLTPGDQYRVNVMRFLPARRLAEAVMTRDKILRVLGRDPNTGVAKAREWAKSPDPELVNDAVVVFEDMGGHEQDYQAAKSALFRLDPGLAELEEEQKAEAIEAQHLWIYARPTKSP